MDKLATKPTAPSRKRLTHGIRFWLRTGKVNQSIRGYKKIQKYLQDLEAQLISDCGGLESLTAAKEILIRSTIRAYGVILLAELYAGKHSILRPDDLERGVMTFQPILERSYANIFGQVRQNLMALGLERREPAEPNILTWVAEFDKEKAAREALEVTGGPEKPQDARSPEDSPNATDNSGGFPGGDGSPL